MFICFDCKLTGILLVAAVTSSPINTVKFECFPNTTMKVENPGNFTYVHANNSMIICNTTWTDDKTSVYINGCRMDDDILVFFSNLEPDFINVLGGKSRETYNINCNEIPLTGVDFTVQNGVQVGLSELEQKNYIEFDKDVKITSGIYEDPIGRYSPDEVMIGTPLFWLIQFNSVHFRIRPDECWAYAGKNIIDSVPKKKIYDNGCFIDDQLLGAFHKMGMGIVGRRAVLYTFRFHGSEYVTFECKVRVCPYNYLISTFCDSNECDTDRRKRDADLSRDGYKELEVSRTLRVIDQYHSSIQNGAPETWLILLSTIIALLKV